MYLLQLLTCTIQFLCIRIFETLLHVTLKRRAEILAETFAGLLQYFSLSYQNLTIKHFNDNVHQSHYRTSVKNFRLVRQKEKKKRRHDAKLRPLSTRIRFHQKRYRFQKNTTIVLHLHIVFVSFSYRFHIVFISFSVV